MRQYKQSITVEYGVTRRIHSKIAILISTRDTVFGWVQPPPPQLSRKVPSFIWYIFCWGPKLVLGVTNEKPKTRICARSFAWTFRFTQVKFLSCCDGFEKNKFQGFWQYIYVGTAKNSFTVKLFQDGNRDVTCFFLFVYLGEFIRF